MIQIHTYTYKLRYNQSDGIQIKSRPNPSTLKYLTILIQHVLYVEVVSKAFLLVPIVSAFFNPQFASGNPTLNLCSSLSPVEAFVIHLTNVNYQSII